MYIFHAQFEEVVNRWQFLNDCCYSSKGTHSHSCLLNAYFRSFISKHFVVLDGFDLTSLRNCGVVAGSTLGNPRSFYAHGDFYSVAAARGAVLAILSCLVEGAEPVKRRVTDN